MNFSTIPVPSVIAAADDHQRAFRRPVLGEEAAGLAARTADQRQKEHAMTDSRRLRAHFFDPRHLGKLNRQRHLVKSGSHHDQSEVRAPHTVPRQFVTGVAILSLALGIGANAAIFSIFNQMLLSALPVQKPEELVNLRRRDRSRGRNRATRLATASGLQLPDVPRPREDADGVHRGRGAPHLRRQPRVRRTDAVSGEGVLVSGSYFPVLGLQPALGRLLNSERRPEDGRVAVVVLSHAYWTTRFGQRADVINQHDDRQRPVDDDRRRRAAGFRGHDARGDGRRSSCRSRCAG